MKFSKIASLHTSKYGCGVGRFGAELAKRLDVPFGDLFGWWGEHPLLSLKWAELADDDRLYVCDKIGERKRDGLGYSVFWHDGGSRQITDEATHVFYADPSLGSPGLWCPSLITPRKRSVRLFSFGMAFKLQTEKYARVRELLDAASIRYHLRVSVGLHEGTSLDGAEKHFDALRAIMGPENVTILGILSDEAVSEELANCDYVLAFFEKGLRANNTTVHTALDHDCAVITNHDRDTPEGLRMMTADVGAASAMWTTRDNLYSWDALIEVMKGVCEGSKLPSVS